MTHIISDIDGLAQTTQTEEFMFQNVAYRTTVYRTGIRWFVMGYILKAGSFGQKLSLSFVFRENATHELQNTHKHQCV